jgi:hypothetical protein
MSSKPPACWQWPKAAEHRAGAPLPRVRDLKARHDNADAYFQFARNMVKGMARNFPAPAKCVDAVEASVKRRFDDGMAYERDLFISLMMTPECKALRHAFFGERAASKIPDVPEDTPQRKVARVAVIGAGTMGGGISMNFLNAGIPVTILEMKQDALDRGVATIRKNYEGQVKKGKLKQDKLDAAHGAAEHDAASYNDIADADLVIEAVFEEMGVKEKGLQDAGRGDEARRHPRQQHQHAGRECHRRLHEAAAGRDRHALLQPRQRDEAAGSGARRGHRQGRAGHGDGAGQEDPQDGGGLGRLRRLHRQPHDRAVRPPGRLPAGRGLHARAGGQGDREVGHGDGAVPHGRPGRQRHRLGHPQAPLCREARHALQQDRRPAVRDGPLRPEDRRRLVRLPAGQARRHPIGGGREDDRGPPPGLGITPRKISDDEIVHRLVYSLVNEAARILEEGIASKASDIDMVYLTGYGFPLHRGGPMCYADQQGLFNVVQAMKRFAANPHDDASFWQPAPLLARLAAEGRSFT